MFTQCKSGIHIVYLHLGSVSGRPYLNGVAGIASMVVLWMHRHLPLTRALSKWDAWVCAVCLAPACVKCRSKCCRTHFIALTCLLACSFMSLHSIHRLSSPIDCNFAIASLLRFRKTYARLHADFLNESLQFSLFSQWSKIYAWKKFGLFSSAMKNWTEPKSNFMHERTFLVLCRNQNGFEYIWIVGEEEEEN